MMEQIKIDFEKTIEKLKLSENDIKLRKKFLDKFLAKGLPNRKIENWKFSDLNQIIKKNIGELNFSNDYSLSNKIDKSILINSFEHNQIFFINGKLEKIDFNYEDQDKIEIRNNHKIEDKFKINNSLTDLNNAFTDKVSKIVIKKNYCLKKPVVVYHITNELIKSTNINLKLEFELEQNSSLRLIDFFSHSLEKNFINVNYNFDLKKDAILKNFKIDKTQNKNIKYFFNNINQDENSISETFILSSGSNFLKNEINCNLNGKHSSAFVNGVFSLMNNKQHEIRTTINHLIENTKSYQLIKSVLGKHSKSVYQGKIFVNPKAQKTDGYQLSKAILLDETSEFNAKPELEIYADDVKCSHGSTSGSLDENSIFYLMSRGLSYQQSKELLIDGFLQEVIEKITDTEIKNLIINMIGLKK